MFNIIPFILILASLIIIIVIVSRKFSVLANLNIDSIPAEKEVKFKEQIIGKRLKRYYTKWTSRFVRSLSSASGNIGGYMSSLYAGLKKIKDEQKTKKSRGIVEALNDTNLQMRINYLYSEADKLRKKEELAEAEKKLIEIISLDSKNIKTFKLLAQIYFDKKEFEEAKQTQQHIIRLLDDEEEYYNSLNENELEEYHRDEVKKQLNIASERSQAYFSIVLIYQAVGKLAEAFKNLKNALKIEPNNPRYLDSMIEISIINKDKISALNAYSSLEKANPENQKLAEFKSQIDQL
jgi:tetratricopeptide (TPR) repeat protein